MSNMFYNYLSERIVKYFNNYKPEAGEKYYVQFETDEQVSCLYEELKKNVLCKPYIYADHARNQQYSSYELDYGKTQLIVSAAIDGKIHPDFLATLRNLVGVEEGYQNKAILFIHCSSLDSIIGGAGSLSKIGFPLNIYDIELDIKRRISETGYSEVDKRILENYLDNKSKELEGTTASIFEYKDIIESLGDSQITFDQYRRFELFPDNKLNGFKGKELTKRLNDNHSNYVRVSEIHSYGVDESKLERFYGDDGAKRLVKADWENTDFSDVLHYIESKKTPSTIEYYPIVNNDKIWDREEGTTKTKSRIRNILIFLSDEDEYELTLSFSEFTRKIGINIPKSNVINLSCESAGKKLILKLSDINQETTFYRLRYEDNGSKFDFRIATLRCSQLLLDGIKTQYSVEIKGNAENAIRVNTDEEDIVMNSRGDGECRRRIIEDDQIIQINDDTKTIISVGEDFIGSEDTDDVRFSITTESTVIPIIKRFVSVPPVVIDGIKLWYLKRVNQCDFEAVSDNSLVLGTKKYFTRDAFKKSLELEREYISMGAPFVIDYGEGLVETDKSFPSDVLEAFKSIIDYFNKRNLIPSLAYLNDELKVLYANYINTICKNINEIQENAYLSNFQKSLFYLGVIKREVDEKEIMLTPLHPINIAYQLHVSYEKIDGLEEDDTDLIRRFQQTALLPYININPTLGERSIYIPVEQLHSPEWKIYVEESLPRYKGSKDFVSKLVSEKIHEFVDHFSYLFAEDSNAPIRLNLINTGDCREIVQGIVRYYVRALNSQKGKHVIPIRVVMYSDKRIDNAFEKMSQIDDVDLLFKTIGIEAKVEDMTNSDIIDLYRENLKFYYKNFSDGLEYGHITFIELDDDHQAISTVMEDIPSGVVMNGLSSGVPSERLGDSYRTGFGTKFIGDNNQLIDISKKYNALNAAMNGDAYRPNICCALRMGTEEQNILNEVYDQSNWVTFINPKVDLNYFKNQDQDHELMIIHYSDQYNMTSSGYDAITVTKKSKQYQNAIGRYLSKNGVENVDSYTKQIINIFNALNGDWLLRMLSYKSHFPIEKLSILSAMKYSVKRYYSESVIWIPISLEEILRVSGSVGLSQSGSIFSAKSLGFDGLTSDDLLLVGIRKGDNIQVTFYPIEVKIGKVESDYLDKGINQANKTRKIFDDILEFGKCKDKSIKTRLYRNFFMQQVLINAGKMQLYEVGDESLKWDEVTNTELRKKIMNEEYEIVERLIPEMGKASVIAFKEDCIKEREFRNQDILIIEKNKTDGINLLTQKIQEIDTVDWSLIEDKPLYEDDINPVESIDIENQVSEIHNDGDLDEEPEIATEEIKEITDRVLIGQDNYMHNVYWEFGNKALANRHMLITGVSGQGKTYSIQTMLYELSKNNVSAVIFDYTEGFMLQQLEEPFKESLGNKISQKIIYSEGVPINPFIRHEIDLAGNIIKEKESDVAARLADIFTHVYDFGPQQYSAIFDAALNGMQKYGDRMNMRSFRDELDIVAEDNKTAKSVISKMSPFFHTVEFNNVTDFDWGKVLYADESKINIIQLTVFSREMQVIITEMMLWDAWYYTKKYGSKDKPFVVVLDEAQNLSHTIKSPSAAILTEGRKFGWSAWFATQSLKILKDDEIVRLLQSAFKLYFKPTDEELVKIAKQLDPTGSKDWLPVLQKLKKGQCIAVGDKMKPNGIVGPAEPVVTNISSFEDRV